MRFELNNLLNSSREKLGKTLYQQIQLADIDLEAYLFVKLSELIEKSKSKSIPEQLHLMVISIQNLMTSNIYREEFGVIAQEI